MQTIEQTIAELGALVEQAESVKESGKDARKVADTFATTRDLLILAEQAGDVIEPAVFHTLGQYIISLRQSGDVDREAGQALARRATGILMADLLDSDTGAKVQALVDRWNLASKTGKGTGGRRSDTGERVQEHDVTGSAVISCLKCQKEVQRVGERAGGFVANSARHYTQQHNEKEHGGKFSPVVSAAWKEALKSFRDGADSVQFGDYTMSRITATVAAA